VPLWRAINPTHVARSAVLLSVAGCVAWLLDIYLGHTDPVHTVMLSAFGPLAFLVPVGVGLLALDSYRRHEGLRPWLHFEESCGAVLLFVAALACASLARVSSSLVGNALSEELTSLLGRPGAVLAVLAVLALGVVLVLRITLAQAAAAGRMTARLLAVGGRRTARTVRGWRARQRTRTRPRRRHEGDHAPAARRPRPGPSPVSAATARARTAGTHLPTLDDVPPPPDFGRFGIDDEAEDERAPESTRWPAPPLDLLAGVPSAAAVPVDNDARAHIIEETLASFNVTADVVDVQSGPTVTQFGLRPAPGVRVQRITALANDLALALAAPSIRIEAPVPGKPVVGIEIPNATTTLVTLREILESDAYARTKSPLKIALGKNVSGEPVVVDLARMPHLLIAGATGSGKSVCLNSLIAGLLFHNSPERLRLLMIDPKMVELTTFNGVPHLLAPVVTEMDKVSGTLKWMLREMHRRYKLFGEAGARNIARYNELQVDETARLPYIVFIIDELADLMMVAAAEVEDSISRLAALARATGIHLVLATQRPSVDVITGVIKANFPARIAFAVSSQVDSRTIIDQAGAEKLLGRGDMLYLPSDGSKVLRVQGTYLSDAEIEAIVEFWTYNAPHAPEQIPPAELDAPKSDGGESENEDKLLAEAGKVVREYRRASVSLLQRRLSIGYSRAARLLDQLEEHGVVGPSEDGRSRVVLDAGADDSTEDATRGEEERS
jgi:DNA segregation ATPase FtsK/SpoIIIE, S-DNA-T family